jgi:D-alanyl-lipoteichoic acid acyltransferase DltB (MBOAT superfamily)
MLFNSPVFLVAFLPLTMLTWFAISRWGSARYGIVFLVAASLFFYGWLNPPYVLLITGSAAVNYWIGRLLSGRRSMRGGRFLFAAGVAGNLSLLGYYKYANFFLENIDRLAGMSFHVKSIILPLGISFFTFQQLAYIVDVYRGEPEEKNFFLYCLFVSFFPKVIAGPIVTKKEFFPQFSQTINSRFNSNSFAEGLSIFLLGLFKKVVIADVLGGFADPVFRAAQSGPVGSLSFFVAWQGALAYTLQIYFDFSAYSDMAIGIAGMMGLKLPVNFNSPYKAVNMRDFWRRWHITLSCLLRDYIYIPLGGNRKGDSRRSLNLAITMLVCGLWHGAGWTFIVWGAMHASFLIINHAWNKLRTTFGAGAQQVTMGGAWCGRLTTFIAVTIAWVVFRAESLSSAGHVLSGMAGFNGAVLPGQILDLFPPLKGIVRSAGSVPLLAGGTVMGFVEFVIMTVMCMAIVFLSKNLYELSLKRKVLLLVPTFAFVLQSVFFGQAPSQFIYFRF